MYNDVIVAVAGKTRENSLRNILGSKGKMIINTVSNIILIIMFLGILWAVSMLNLRFGVLNFNKYFSFH